MICHSVPSIIFYKLLYPAKKFNLAPLSLQPNTRLKSLICYFGPTPMETAINTQKEFETAINFVGMLLLTHKNSPNTRRVRNKPQK